MNTVKNIFTEKDGIFSWRKLMTAGALVCFMTAVLGWLIEHKFEELPNSYQVIIAGVFVFYFGKHLIEKTQITTKQ